MNELIISSEIRVIADDGEQLGNGETVGAHASRPADSGSEERSVQSIPRK